MGSTTLTGSWLNRVRAPGGLGKGHASSRDAPCRTPAAAQCIRADRCRHRGNSAALLAASRCRGAAPAAVFRLRHRPSSTGLGRIAARHAAYLRYSRYCGRCSGDRRAAASARGRRRLSSCGPGYRAASSLANRSSGYVSSSSRSWRVATPRGAGPVCACELLGAGCSRRGGAEVGSELRSGGRVL